MYAFVCRLGNGTFWVFTQDAVHMVAVGLQQVHEWFYKRGRVWHQTFGFWENANPGCWAYLLHSLGMRSCLSSNELPYAGPSQSCLCTFLYMGSKLGKHTQQEDGQELYMPIPWHLDLLFWCSFSQTQETCLQSYIFVGYGCSMTDFFKYLPQDTWRWEQSPGPDHAKCTGKEMELLNELLVEPCIYLDWTPCPTQLPTVAVCSDPAKGPQHLSGCWQLSMQPCHPQIVWS